MWGNFILVVIVFGLCKDLSFKSILGRCDNIQVETLVRSFPCSPTTTRRQMLGDSTRFSSQQTWSRLRTQLRAARRAERRYRARRRQQRGVRGDSYSTDDAAAALACAAGGALG